MPTITDATVVAQAYDTSGNGGRKLVRLDNGWLVAVVKTTTAYYVQKSVDNGNNWTSLYSVTGLTSMQDISLVGIGNNICFVYSVNNNAVNYKITNVLDGSNVISGSMDNSQTALGNVSLAINEAKTELHATWASKNSAYPNSFNIRYAKGTINADGTVTWGAVEQVTNLNNASYNFNYASNYIDKDGYFHCVVTQQGTNNYVLDLTKRYGTQEVSVASGWGSKTIYSGSTYAQSSPSAIFVPQSINGLANGRIWVAWSGKDSTDTSYDNIKCAYSDDLGVTWSSLIKITTGILGNNAQYRPTITANKLNEIFIVWVGSDSEIQNYSNVRMVKNTSGTWGSITRLTNFTTSSADTPNALYDMNVNFSSPLFIYRDSQTPKVGFYGTWTVTTISVTPGDIGQKTDKNNILSYSITTDGEMSTITEKINGTVVNTRNTTSGQAVTLGLTQAQWDAIRFGKYADATGGKNTLTVEMGSEKWTYTFDKQLASDSDIISASKAVKDANEVYLPVQISRLADVAKGKGAVIPANPKIDDIVDGIKKSANGRVLSGIATSSSTPSQYEVLNSTSAYNFYTVTVTGLTFKPKRIVIKPQNTSASIVYLTEYHYAMSSYQNEQVFIIGYQPAYVTNAVLVGLKADKNGLSVTSTGFTLPGKDANVVYEWTAYEN